MRMASQDHFPCPRWFYSLVSVGSCICLFWLTSACQTSCHNNNTQPIRYVDGRKLRSISTQVYESTPFDGEWLDFQGGRRFLFQHNLNSFPYLSMTMYIAFSSNPIPADGDAGDVALATGDVAVVEKMNANQLQLYNDTCSEQYLYVRITADLPQPDAGIAGM